MHYSNIILLVVGVINLFLSFFVYIRNKKSKSNILFAITILGIAAWCFGIAFFRMATLATVYFWGQFVYFAVNFTIVFFLYFSFVFPKGEFPKSKLIKLILFLPPIIIWTISLIPHSIIADAVVHSNGEIDARVGWGYYIHSVVTFIFMAWAFANLVTKFLKSSGTSRLQLWYLFLGTIASTIIAVITNLILFFFTTKYNWVGPTGTIIMVVFVAYAITRYRLMDIRLVVFRSLAFGFFVLVITITFAIISGVIATFFQDILGFKSNLISGLIVGILVSVTYQPLRRSIEGITDRFLYKKSYNPDILLAQIAEVTSSILDLHNLLASIAKTLVESLHCEKIGVVLLNKKNKLEIFYQEGFVPLEAEKLANYPNVVKILNQELKNIKGILVIDEMKTRYENGEFQPVDAKLLLSLYQNDIALIIPLYVKEQLIGIIAFGTKKSGDPYNRQDLNVLKLISGQAGIAIENARLYDELKDFNVKLEEEVRRKTAQLRRANQELRQLDQAKSEFISIASHQLRTPLTVIKGYISMMREGSFGPVSPTIMANLEKVYASNERLIGLVENLLDISRIESGRQEFDWKKVRLEDIAQTVVDNLKNTATAKNLTLLFNKPKVPTPEITADPNKIHEVMMNFVDNAIKYTEKGEIIVSFLHEPQKDLITFCVKDTGRGVEKNMVPLLFRKFSRGKGSFRVHTEGVGLGLYVAKMIIDAHRGRIWVESEGADKGSKFCFSLSTKAGLNELSSAQPEKKFGQSVPAKKLVTK
ncbi:MAG: ATP-binding protein [Patescibacteria group bacterium]|jgi:signal transduction histidine kinase